MLKYPNRRLILSSLTSLLVLASACGVGSRITVQTPEKERINEPGSQGKPPAQATIGTQVDLDKGQQLTHEDISIQADPENEEDDESEIASETSSVAIDSDEDYGEDPSTPPTTPLQPPFIAMNASPPEPTPGPPHAAVQTQQSAECDSLLKYFTQGKYNIREMPNNRKKDSSQSDIWLGPLAQNWFNTFDRWHTHEGIIQENDIYVRKNKKHLDSRRMCYMLIYYDINNIENPERLPPSFEKWLKEKFTTTFTKKFNREAYNQHPWVVNLQNDLAQTKHRNQQFIVHFNATINNTLHTP